MNITEYVKEFGDKPLPKFNIKQADVFVLTALSYIDFSTVPAQFCNGIKLSEAINHLFAFGIRQRNEDFLKNLRDSKRFSDLYICGYRNETDEQNHAMQFSALTIKISDNLWFLSYSGTDGTIVGWKEDFQFSYLSQTPAQEKALNYLKEATENLNGNFIISGHSKGGNLASYASIFADKAIQQRINGVFCNDSPGFNKNIDIQEGYENIKQKIYCIIPQDSIIGQLLQIFPEKHFSIIYSKANKILYQHDIFNWQINEYGNPCWLPMLSPLTNIGMKKINNLISDLSMDKREKLTNSIFDVLEKQNIRHVDALKFFLSMEYFKFLK